MSDDSPFDDYGTVDNGDSGDINDFVGSPSDSLEQDNNPINDTPADEDPFAAVDNSTDDPSRQGFDFQVPDQKEQSSEETPLSLWEKERQQVLQERGRKAAEDKNALLAAAREETEKFYSEQQNKVEKISTQNRADEKGFRQDMKSLMEHGTRWEKVNKLVNLAPKAGEKPGTSRVERMRKVLIQLKQTKEKSDK